MCRKDQMHFTCCSQQIVWEGDKRRRGLWQGLRIGPWWEAQFRRSHPCPLPCFVPHPSAQLLLSTYYDKGKKKKKIADKKPLFDDSDSHPRRTFDANNNNKKPQASKEYAVGYEKNKKSNKRNQDRQKSGILKIGDRAENCDPCNHP